MTEVSMIGVDLAKTVFHVHGADAVGRPVLRKKLRRSQLLPFFAGLAPARVGLEAGAAAHHWARELQALGHDVRLIPPQYVKPFVKTNKNDAVDAEAICEALARPTMRFAQAKTPEQQSALILHRSRRQPERRSSWMENLLARRPTNVVVVAMAKKLARVVFALLSRSETYKPRSLQSA